MADVLKQRAQELPAPIQMRPSRLRPRDRAAQMGAAAEIGARRSDGATIKPGKLTFEEGLTFGISTALANPRNMMRKEKNLKKGAKKPGVGDMFFR